MAQGGKDDGNDSGGAVTALLVLVSVLFISWVVWTKLHTQIVSASSPIRLAQIAIFSFFTRELDPLAEWIRTVNPAEVTFEQFTFVAAQVGQYFRWLALPLAGVLIWILYRGNVYEHNRRRENIDSLMRSQWRIWPQIKCVVGKNLHKKDPTKGPWASSPTEYEFAIAKKLLGPAGDLDREKAKAVFIEQLGPRWEGPERLDPLTRVVFALYAGRVASEAEDGDKMKDEIYALTLRIANDSTPDPNQSTWEWLQSLVRGKRKVDTTWVNPLIKRVMKDATVQSICERHAYVSTVLAGMIQRAHLSGVMPSSDFLWVKPRNRRLFYLINAVDRRSFLIESAGIMGHYLAEVRNGGPLTEPFVTKAVDALEETLSWFIYDEDKQPKE